LKVGFDAHDCPRRMELATQRLRENKKVSLCNRPKILKFMDYLESCGVSLPRRIRYLIELTRLASMLRMDFEQATKTDIEKVILEHGRLDVTDKDPNDPEYPLEVKWIKTTVKNRRNLLPDELLAEDDIAALVRAAERP